MNDSLYSKSPPHAEIQLSENRLWEELIPQLRALHLADKQAEKDAAKWGKWANRFLFLIFLAIFLGAILIVPLALIPIFLGFFLMYRGRRIKAENQDLDDRKLHTASKLLQTLGPELKRSKPIALQMDFGGYEKAIPLQEEGNWSQKNFVWKKPWLKMSFVLLDGSTVGLEASSSVKRKEISKRKWTKKKDKIIEDLIVTIKPPKGRSLSPAPLEQRLRGVFQDKPLLVKRVQLKPQLVTIHFQTPRVVRQLTRYEGWVGEGLAALVDGDTALMAVISSYRALQSAGQTTA